MSAIDVHQTTSTRPYLIRALYEWCTDNGLTPYIAVMVDDTVQVPREYVKNGEIVLNVSFDATSGLQLGNEHIEFKARFAGVARDIMVPVGRVIAVYARENGQGMAFPMPPAASDTAAGAPSQPADRSPSGVDRPVSLVPVGGAAGPAAPTLTGAAAEGPAEAPDDGDGPPSRPPPGGRPALKRIK